MLYSMNFFILALAIYGVTATSINSTNNNEKIIGGFDAYDGQFPYQALVRHSNHLRFLCSGSIISNQWILTSALCTKTYNPKKMRIVVGSIYLNSGGTTYTVLISLKHPDFEIEFQTNDIGLIRVNGQINYNDFVRPIQLSSDSSSIGLPLTIAGWGLTSISPEIVFTNTLQYGIHKSMSLDECKKLLTGPLPLFDTQLCTHGKGLYMFYGGSTVVYNGQQYAVVSLPAYCLYSSPDVHTRVAPYRSWIREITNI